MKKYKVRYPNTTDTEIIEADRVDYFDNHIDFVKDREVIAIITEPCSVIEIK